MEDKMHIHTIQSYMVFETEKFYQKIIAEDGISHFYSFKGSQNSSKQIPLFADGCSNLLFEYSDTDVASYLIGNSNVSNTLNIKKNCEYFGIRFQPGTNPYFEHQEAKDLLGQKIDLRDFPILKDLTLKMEEQDTFTTRMCTFMQEYRKYLEKSNTQKKQLFYQIVNLIVKNDGLLRINELIKLTGYSSRYVNQLFETYLGYSPKQFTELVKMHTVINVINKTEVKSLTGLSNDYKFYDQSHFVKSFKDFAGMTPGDYIKKVKDYDYATKVLNEGIDF